MRLPKRFSNERSLTPLQEKIEEVCDRVRSFAVELAYARELASTLAHNLEYDINQDENDGIAINLVKAQACVLNAAQELECDMEFVRSKTKGIIVKFGEIPELSLESQLFSLGKFLSVTRRVRRPIPITKGNLAKIRDLARDLNTAYKRTRVAENALSFASVALDYEFVLPSALPPRFPQRVEHWVTSVPAFLLDPRVAAEELGDARELADARLAQGERELRVVVFFLCCVLVAIFNSLRMRVARAVGRRQPK